MLRPPVMPLLLGHAVLALQNIAVIAPHEWPLLRQRVSGHFTKCPKEHIWGAGGLSPQYQVTLMKGGKQQRYDIATTIHIVNLRSRRIEMLGERAREREPCNRLARSVGLTACLVLWGESDDDMKSSLTCTQTNPRTHTHKGHTNASRKITRESMHTVYPFGSDVKL